MESPAWAESNTLRVLSSKHELFVHMLQVEEELWGHKVSTHSQH